jgi:hypothetical protein
MTKVLYGNEQIYATQHNIEISLASTLQNPAILVFSKNNSISPFILPYNFHNLDAKFHTKAFSFWLDPEISQLSQRAQISELAWIAFEQGEHVLQDGTRINVQKSATNTGFAEFVHALQLLKAHFVLSSEEDTNEHDTAISDKEAANNEISVAITLADANVPAPKGRPNSELDEYFNSLIASLKFAQYRSQYPQNKEDIVQNTSQNVESKQEADKSEENAERDTDTPQVSEHTGRHSEKFMPELHDAPLSSADKQDGSPEPVIDASAIGPKSLQNKPTQIDSPLPPEDTPRSMVNNLDQNSTRNGSPQLEDEAHPTIDADLGASRAITSLQAGSDEVIGESGVFQTPSFTNQSDQFQINFATELLDPVIMLTGTKNAQDSYALYVEEVITDPGTGVATGFKFSFPEWNYDHVDVNHNQVEDIHWVAIERGTHTLSDGRTVVAGTTNNVSYSAQSVNFGHNFSSKPIVLTNVASHGSSHLVDSDPTDITTSSFSLQLQSDQNRHEVSSADVEKVGWIAIEPGGSGASGKSGEAKSVSAVNHTEKTVSFNTTNDAVVIAETQTSNGPDVANVTINNVTSNSVSVKITETNYHLRPTENGSHINEEVGVAIFKKGQLILCFGRGTEILTPKGARAIETLQADDLVLSRNAQEHGEFVPTRVVKVLRKKISQQDLVANPKLFPVKIKAGALGQKLPYQDLTVSRQHRMIVSSKITNRMFKRKDVFVAAIRLTELPGIFEDTAVKEVEYYHLILEEHRVVIANGAPSESFYFGNEALKGLAPETYKELLEIFPTLSENSNLHTNRSTSLVSNAKQRRLVYRHARNNASLLSA